MLSLPAGEGCGGGAKVKIMPVRSITKSNKQALMITYMNLTYSAKFNKWGRGKFQDNCTIPPFFNGERI